MSQLDYLSPGTLLPRRGVRGLVWMLILSYLFYGLAMAALVLYIPRFKQIFADFKIELPFATIWVLGASDYCRRFNLWALLASLPALCSIGIWKIPNPASRRWVRLAAIVVMLGISLFIAVAMCLPLIDLIDGITSQPARK